MRVHCRCRVCRTRQTKPKPLEEYKRNPVCYVCRGPLVVDSWANGKPWRKFVCLCDGYHFPHRRSSKFCMYRKDETRRLPGDPDFRHPQLEMNHE